MLLATTRKLLLRPNHRLCRTASYRSSSSSSSSATSLIYNNQYIGGEFIPSTDINQLLTVDDSNTSEPYAHVPAGTEEDVNRAVNAASDAFHFWSSVPLQERKVYVERIVTNYQRRKDEVADVLMRELGAPKKWAGIQSKFFTYVAQKGFLDMIDDFPWTEDMGKNSLVVKEPIGVVGAITPWNYPVYQIACKMIPALLTGCTVVLKPSEVTPVCAYIVAEVVHESDLPPGVFNMVCGTGSNCGEVLASHRKVDMISFTGSTQVGKRMHSLGAGSTLKRVRTELGGKSAAIILNDATAQQIETVAMDVLSNSGQTCSALSRLIVPRDRYDEIVQIAKTGFESKSRAVVTSDSTASRWDIGPLASRKQWERVREYIRIGIEEDGAQLVTGGLDPPEGIPAGGYFVRPTIFSNVRNDMTIAQEEIFGPVLCIIPYETEEEAINIANDTVYGLSNAVVGNDVDHAMRVARQLRSGEVSINGTMPSPVAPFGGYKQSGDGREIGKYGLEEFLQIKAIHRNQSNATFG